MDRLKPHWPIIWTGDINVAPEEIDVFDPGQMAGEVGFHPDEHAALESVKAWGFTDLFRKHHPHAKQFTFWDYRIPKGFQRNLGWRLDHIFATEALAEASVSCTVDMGPRGRERASDHTPVLAEIDMEKVKPVPVP
jgi:exodeoxyribonuclease-3